ncbi:CU044_5270 family protein [Streptomyces sp. GMY02]|uniref:CU044_5270 family protein n=1 Tax=Streptomyces sp. GMY02 TaxID=1333528 RepID=UPI001C2BF922|nr:CU044_5270 family protein [Streptomyces sp. GMY02]QXE35930.1 CU044_5270 family protein [Streptomyces sp. GMY02]
MNSEQSEMVERADAEAVLPPAPYPVPTPAAFHLHKQNLLLEIDRRSSPSAPRPTRTRRRVVIALASAAVACAAFAAVVLPNIGTAPAPEALPASTASVQLLERAALVAVANPAAPPRATQFTYVKVTGHTTALSENEDGTMERLPQDESYEQWTSVDGSARTMQRKDGSGENLLDAPGRGNLNLPTYQFLARLPTEPGALLKLIYQDANLNHGPSSDSTTGPDQEAFVIIGDLLRASIAPPEVSAALYRAAARIPGVITVPNSVDAVGRHGVAVARVHNGERIEWIFDKKTMRLLGERTVLLEDNAWGKAGTAVTSTAITGSGIADEAGQLPTGSIQDSSSDT